MKRRNVNKTLESLGKRWYDNDGIPQPIWMAEANGKGRNKEHMKELLHRIENSRWMQTPFAGFVRNCIEDKIGRSSAALAYYFLFSFFPLILFVGLLLSGLSENADVTQLLSNRMIPTEVIDTIISLLDYSSELGRNTLMFAGVVMSLYGGSRAVACLSESINRSYNLTETRHPVIQFLINLAFSALFLVALSVTLVVVVSTPDFLGALERIFGIGGWFVDVWGYLRFILILVIFLVLLVILYSVVPNRRIKFRQALPGAAAASLGWVAVSAAFSLYVSNMARYSLLYGSIGAVVVLMLWLYFTGVVLIAGAEFNHTIMQLHARRKKEI